MIRFRKSDTQDGDHNPFPAKSYLPTERTRKHRYRLTLQRELFPVAIGPSGASHCAEIELQKFGGGYLGPGEYVIVNPQIWTSLSLELSTKILLRC